MKRETKFVLVFVGAAVLAILGYSLMNHPNTSGPASPLTTAEQAAYEAALRATPTAEELDRKRQADLLARAEDRALLSTPGGRIRYNHRDWSLADCDRIARGELWIGMTMEQAETVWPRPASRRVTKTAFGEHVQLCYGDFCESSLYFDNGRLTTIQRRD